MLRPILFPLLLACLYGCAADLPPGAKRFILRGQIKPLGGTTYQTYWELGDTAAWEATVAAADTTYREDGYWKFRSNKIWYEVLVDQEGRLRTEQPYPGWERQVDSLKNHNGIVYTRRWHSLIADIPAADILLGNDSLRIGIINVKGKAFPWQSFELNEPDYLVLFPPGENEVPVSLNLSNVGAITSQTIFRVGRRQYALTYLSEDRREIVIEPYEGASGSALTAVIDPIYRAAPVVTPGGENTKIKRSDGKELVLFFTSTYVGSEKVLRELDSTYQALPPTSRGEIDVAVIFQHYHFFDNTSYLDTLGIDLPLYLADENTCKRLICRTHLPYYIHINKRGRITTFWGRADDLAEKWASDIDNPTK